MMSAGGCGIVGVGIGIVAVVIVRGCISDGSEVLIFAVKGYIRGQGLP